MERGGWKTDTTIFQSTLPARGSDTDKERQLVTVDISIHAPRKGERPYNLWWVEGAAEFQSTLPARGSDWV